MMAFRTSFITMAGAFALAAFLQPAVAAGVNQAAAAKVKSYVSSNSLACMSCHAIDHKVLGPGWDAVAEKYKGKPGAATDLAKRIANGGSGIWGSMPMPPGQATPAQSKVLANMILELAAK